MTERRGLETPDISERGGIKEGQQQRSDVRLFMQFMAFGRCDDAGTVADTLARAKIDGVLYEDVNDPRGIGLVTFSEDADYFLDRVRPIVNEIQGGQPGELVQKPDYTMLGRTYGLGHEPDLTDVLLSRPRRTVLNPLWKWAVWYPLRRSGKFAQLSDQEQRVILAEHGAIGRAFGAADYAHDIRLACHGLDKDDNDFVVGLIGKDLYPLSAVVQAMRKTQQTALYIERLGPFFVGRAVWQSPMTS